MIKNLNMRKFIQLVLAAVALQACGGSSGGGGSQNATTPNAAVGGSNVPSGFVPGEWRLPFKPGVRVICTQAPGGSFSHTGKLQGAYDFVYVGDPATNPRITTIVAMRSMVVEQVRTDATGFEQNSFGNFVFGKALNKISIKDSAGNPKLVDSWDLYGHFKYMTILVNPGDVVLQGQPIATIGKTGLATGIHVHVQSMLLGITNAESFFFSFSDASLAANNGVAKAGEMYISDNEPKTQTLARVSHPYDVVIKDSSTAYVSKRGNLAFSIPGEVVELDLQTGQEKVLVAGLLAPGGLALDGNVLHCAVTGEHRLISIDLGTKTVSTICGTLFSQGYNGDRRLAITALLNKPTDVLVDSGKLVVVDSGNHLLREISGGLIEDLAGTPTIPGNSGNGGEPLMAKMDFPTRIASVHSNVYYVIDKGERVRRIVPTRIGTVGIIEEVPLNTQAQFSDIIFDDLGNLAYVSDQDHTINKIAGNQVVKISGELGVAGDQDDTLSKARFNTPLGIWFHKRFYYVCDFKNGKIRTVPR